MSEEARQLRERLNVSEQALCDERTLGRKLWDRLDLLFSAAHNACVAWEKNPSASLHELRGVMRELRRVLNSPNQKGPTWSQKVGEWRRKTFGTGTPERSFQRALEELNEMLGALGLPSYGIDNPQLFTNIDWKHVGKEAADFCIALAAFLHEQGIDLSNEIDDKHRINSTERQWHSNGDGTGYHIKPGQSSF